MVSHVVDRSENSTVMVMIRLYNSSSCKRLTALIFTLLAVISPLLMDRRRTTKILAEEIIEELEQPFSLSSYLPLILLVLSMAIVFSGCRDHSFWNRFDPYWIHRTVGSSFGMLFFLLVLALVLKCKAAI